MTDQSSASSIRRPKMAYPLMATLLVISPEMHQRMSSSQPGRGATSTNRKLSFLHSVRAGLTTNKAYEVCVVSYIDIMRAASYVAPRLQQSRLKDTISEFRSEFMVSSHNALDSALSCRVPSSHPNSQEILSSTMLWLMALSPSIESIRMAQPGGNSQVCSLTRMSPETWWRSGRTLPS